MLTLYFCSTYCLFTYFVYYNKLVYLQLFVEFMCISLKLYLFFVNYL
jgi:hypothetical protein